MNTMTDRLVVGGGALVVGLVLGWAVHGLAGYNPATETVTNSQDWRTACPPATAKDQNCELVQDILDSKSHSEIASIAVASDAGKHVLAITLPMGVALEPGVGISFGSDPVQVIQYRTCNMRGCLAELPVDDKLQASLNAGKNGRVLFAGLDNKPVEIPLSLKGFAEAQKLYRSNEAKRGSWFWRMW
jgi:invasion protein IalB